MIKKNFLSGKDKMMFEMAEQFEQAQEEDRHIYMDADDWADLADWYAIRKQEDKAFATVEYGLSQHPGNTALLVEQAYLFLDNKQLEHAFEVAENIQENYLPEVKILKATLYFNKGEDWLAEEILEDIEDKDSLTNIVEVAYMYIENEAPDRALPWLMLGKGRYDKEEAYIRLSADYFYAVGELEEAQKIFNQLIDINPYSAPYWYGLGRTFYDAGNYNKAIEAADFAIVTDEEFGEAYYLRANAYMSLGNNENALEDFTQAFKYKCIPVDYYYSISGMILMYQEQYQQACEAYEKAIKHAGPTINNISLIYAQMAQCQLKLNNFQQAHDYCQKGKETDAKEVMNYIVEGSIYTKENNIELGLKMWSYATTVSNDYNTWGDIATAALEVGLTDIAQKCYEKSEQLDTSYPYLYEKMTLTYLLNKNKEKFLEYNQRCEKPLQMTDLKRIQQMIDNQEIEEVVKVFKDIMNSIN